MKKTVTYTIPRSGMPLGGIGTGTVEIRPDGELHEWQIHNPQKFSVDSRDIENPDNGKRLSGSLSFYALTKDKNDTKLRRLGLGFGSTPWEGEQEYNYRMYSFNKPVEGVAYKAAFPQAEVEYVDSALPVEIRMKASSPFVPYDEKTSGTPGFFMTFTVHNPSDEAVTVSLAAKLQNFLPRGERRNDIVSDGDRRTIVLRAPWEKENMALSVRGGEITALPGDYPSYTGEYVSHGPFGVVEESFIFGLRRSGKLPCAAKETRIRKPEFHTADEVSEMTAEEVRAKLEALKKYGFAESIIERNLISMPNLCETDEGRRKLLACLYINLENLEKKGKWGDCALCSTLVLAPGETRDVEFVFSWYFPNLISGSNTNVGHVYENWFKDALEVNDFLAEKRGMILEKAERFSKALYAADYPEEFSDAVSQQLSNLIKSSWWTKDGSFGIWEGLGSCGFHTMDITYHGSFGLVTLFPALQKAQMEMGARFQREDGRVHHFFTPDFSRVDNGFDRVDMNPQFVLLIYRDYIATGDSEYLGRLWPRIIRAIDNIRLLDTNGDALPDKDAGRNTYDAWHFNGTSTYISMLWLAALKAGCALAKAMGDENRAKEWAQLVETGSRAVDEKLFNGSYYNLWIDGDVSDACCMTDQLDGEYFARVTGLGGILPENHVRSALNAIYALNYSEENGLINARYPEGTMPTLYTCRNCQALANWSGIEFMMSAFYILMGEYEKGLSVTKNVQERYSRLGEIFNHEECGDHYYRPMSSWVLMQALSGMRVDMANGVIHITPNTAKERYKAPWFTATGYGIIERDGDRYTLSCTEGTLNAKALLVDDKPSLKNIALQNGSSISFTK